MKLWSAEERRRCASEWLAPERIRAVLYWPAKICKVHPQEVQRVYLQEYKGYIPSHQREEGREGDWLPCIEKRDLHSKWRDPGPLSGTVLQGTNWGIYPLSYMQGVSPQDTELYKVYPRNTQLCNHNPRTWLGVTSEL